jgi:oligosaccharide repeat unit polymerase
MHAELSTLPAIGATVILLVAIVADIRHDLRRLVSGRSVVLLGILSWFLFEALTETRGLVGYTQSEFNFGVLCVVLAIGAFLVGYHFTKGCGAFEPIAKKVRQLDNPRLLWRLVVICAVIGFAPVLFYSGLQLITLLHGILGMRETWGGLLARGRYGGFREAMLQLELLVIGVGPFAVILLLDRRSTGLQRLVCAIVAVWPLLRAFGGGTRSALIMAVLPVLAIAYFRSAPRVQRAMIAVGLCATPLLYGLMAAIVASRNSGNFSWEARTKATYVGNEMFQELLYITTRVPDSVPYQMGASYIVQLCAPIPRFLWPGKPSLDTGILMAELRGEVDKRSGQAYYTRSPGLLGEMYLNFGLLGVIGLNFFGGWIVRGWDRIHSRHSSSLPTMIFYLVGLAALYFLGRSFNTMTFYPLAFFVAAVFLVSYVCPGDGAPTNYRADAPQPLSRGRRVDCARGFLGNWSRGGLVDEWN